MILHMIPFTKKEPLPVIFLHGLGGTGVLWKPIIRMMPPQFACISFDQRGHGKSRVADSYHAIDFGQDVVESVESYQIKKSLLIGHSMGVRTALAAAFIDVGLFWGLICVDYDIQKTPEDLLKLEIFMENLPDRFESSALASAYMKANAPDISIAQYLTAVLLIKPDGSVDFPFDRAAIIETIQSAKDAKPLDWLYIIGKQIPVLLLRGEKSQMWSKESYEKIKKSFSSFDQVEFEEFSGTGHGLPFEKKNEFVARIETFYQKYGPK